MCKANLIFCEMKLAYMSTLEFGEIIQIFCAKILSYIRISAVHMILDFHVRIFWVIHASEDDKQQAWKLNQKIKIYSYGVWHLPYPHTLFVWAADASETFSFVTSELFTLRVDNNMGQIIV